MEGGSWVLNNGAVRGVKVWRCSAQMAETSVDMENLFHRPWTWRQHPAGDRCGCRAQGEGAIVLGGYLWEKGRERGEEEEEEEKMRGCIVLFGEGEK